MPVMLHSFPRYSPLDETRSSFLAERDAKSETKAATGPCVTATGDAPRPLACDAKTVCIPAEAFNPAHMAARDKFR